MKLFGMSMFGGKPTEYRSTNSAEGNRDPESLKEIDTDRALELLSRLPEVTAALADFNDFQVQMAIGGFAPGDTTIAAEKRAAVVAALASAGYRLEEVPSKYGEHNDESVEVLARAHAKEADMPLAA